MRQKKTQPPYTHFTALFSALMPDFSPLQRDVIRLAAFVAMAGDHIATAFLLEPGLLNMAGRCAFPLFALVSGCNLAGRVPSRSSVNRLWLMAVIAQPCFWLAFREAGMCWWQLNILFTFALAMQGVRCLQQRSIFRMLVTPVCLALYLPLSSASYGLPGLLMLALALVIWQVRKSLRPGLFVLWLLVVMLMNARHGRDMMLSGVMFTLTVIFCVRSLFRLSEKRLPPGHLFAPAYAIHLILIALLTGIL